jgi:hypothetical protein
MRKIQKWDEFGHMGYFLSPTQRICMLTNHDKEPYILLYNVRAHGGEVSRKLSTLKVVES